MSIEISVIIPTHNRAEILKKSLLALDKQTYPAAKYEIIVIDDGSTDNTGEMLGDLKLEAELIQQYQEQTGPAGARNRGIKLARGEYIIFIDDDIIVTPEFIEEHLRTQRENDRAIVHGPVIYTNNFRNPTREEMKLTDYSRAFFATGNVSIRKQYLEEVGLFNEVFTEYGWEDLEIGHRLKKINLKAVKAAEARGFHYKHSFSLDSIPFLLEKERQRGRMAVLFFRERPDWNVRLMTLYWKPFFYLEKILTVGNWPRWSLTRKLLGLCHRQKRHLLRNFLFYFMKLDVYFQGMKEVSRGPHPES